MAVEPSTLGNSLSVIVNSLTVFATLLFFVLELSIFDISLFIGLVVCLLIKNMQYTIAHIIKIIISIIGIITPAIDFLSFINLSP